MGSTYARKKGATDGPAAQRSTATKPQGSATVADTSIDELEVLALDSLGLVVRQLDDCLRSVMANDIELATAAIAANDRIEKRTQHVYRRVLRLMGAPGGAVALRRVAGLLHVIGCVERMGNECVTIASLASTATVDAVQDPELFETIDRLARLTRSQVVLAQETFASRNVALADELVGRSSEFNRLNRQLFMRMIDLGHDRVVHDWAVFVNLLADCLQQIVDEAVGIAEQTVYVSHGLFHELAAGLGQNGAAMPRSLC